MSSGIANPEIVARRQEQWSTDPDIIKTKVSEITGVEVTGLERILKGAQNEVYKVITSKDPVIVRIPHRNPNILDYEAIAKEKAASAHVPVPKTLGIVPIEVNGKSLKMEVSEFIDGVEMNELFESASEEEKKRLTIEAGKILGKIHSVRLSRYGTFANKPNGFEKLSELRLSDTEKKSAVWKSGLISGGYSQDQAQKIINQFKNLCLKYDELDPTLVHHDFLPRHLMVKDGKIVSLIDWENSRSTTPFDELANSTPGAFNQEWLLEGYGQEQIGIRHMEDFNQRLQLAHLFLDLKHYEFIFNNNPSDKDEKIKNTTDRIKKNLTELGIKI